MSTRIRLGIVLGLVAMLTLSLAGCQAIAQKATETAVEKATGVKVDEGGDKVTITGKDGNSATYSGSEGKLPDGLPADFPTYEGTIKTSGKVESDEGTNWSYSFTTPDSVQTVSEWYKSKLKAAGWTITASTTGSADGEESNMTMAERGTKKEEQAIVTMTRKQGGDTEAAVVLNVKTKK